VTVDTEQLKYIIWCKD